MHRPSSKDINRGMLSRERESIPIISSLSLYKDALQLILLALATEYSSKSASLDM
jgi:hypothetical protein